MSVPRSPRRIARRLAAFALALMAALPLRAAPEAALVMDARTGAVLRAENADARLHPASLTKMMTLYVAFAAIEAGEIDVDAIVTASANAAAEPGSRLGLAEGTRLSIRHLIRAVAVRSANDAATALAEAVAGSEAAFVTRMNRTAAAMGLAGTTFRNAHGLTAPDHLSTARDMSELGRRLLRDFPGYRGLYARRTADAGLRRVAHTNRRFLAAYAGADGIKTGYTRAAGYNLTASATRDGRTLIVAVFGAPSSAARAARAAKLMDRGFARLPDAATRSPAARPDRSGPRPPDLLAAARPLLAPSEPGEGAGVATGLPIRPRQGGLALAGIGGARPGLLSAAGRQPARPR